MWLVELRTLNCNGTMKSSSVKTYSPVTPIPTYYSIRLQTFFVNPTFTHQDLGRMAPGRMGGVCAQWNVGQCPPVEESARDQGWEWNLDRVGSETVLLGHHLSTQWGGDINPQHNIFLTHSVESLRIIFCMLTGWYVWFTRNSWCTLGPNIVVKIGLQPQTPF